MIFCGSWLLMAFCWLRAHGRANCMFGCRLQAEVLRRQTRWSCVYVFVVMRLPAVAAPTRWPHCVVEGNNKAAGAEALPEGPPHKFLPRPSPRSQLRAVALAIISRRWVVPASLWSARAHVWWRVWKLIAQSDTGMTCLIINTHIWHIWNKSNVWVVLKRRLTWPKCSNNMNSAFGFFTSCGKNSVQSCWGWQSIFRVCSRNAPLW